MSMFSGAAFNQDVGNWDTSGVIDVRMFRGLGLQPDIVGGRSAAPWTCAARSTAPLPSTGPRLVRGRRRVPVARSRHAVRATWRLQKGARHLCADFCADNISRSDIYDSTDSNASGRGLQHDDAGPLVLEPHRRRRDIRPHLTVGDWG